MQYAAGRWRPLVVQPAEDGRPEAGLTRDPEVLWPEGYGRGFRFWEERHDYLA